jgi:signal transduction histidine kinase
MADDLEAELERHKAALRACEARFRNVIERNADGVVVLTHEGVVLYMNPAAEALFGCTAADCEGTLLGIPLVPDERAEVDVPHRGRPAVVAELRVVETEWEGRPALLASLRDVTDRKRAEEALREADRRKDEFLAMLAHELRNPLAPIKNAAQVFRVLGPADTNLQYAREVIDRQVGHLSRLVDDLLDVSRITRGKISLQKERLEVATVVARAVETSRPLIESRGHDLVVSLPGEPVSLLGDLTRLSQVVSNLLTNAAKYTPEGGRIWLTVAREADEVAVEVRDTGVGIPPDMLGRVFELFTQVDRSLDRSEGGLGIGLTLVRSLVELHGGTVEAQSDGPGRGSRFVVRLPALADGDRKGVRPEDPPARAGSPARRILVVDDNGDAADSLALLLSIAGHATRTARDGPQALAAAEEFRPEVVILDLGLPGIDGYEMARRLRERYGPDAPLLVALTGYGQEEDRRRSHEAGFDHHVVKPPDLAILESLLFRRDG